MATERPIRDGALRRTRLGVRIFPSPAQKWPSCEPDSGTFQVHHYFNVCHLRLAAGRRGDNNPVLHEASDRQAQTPKGHSHQGHFCTIFSGTLTPRPLLRADCNRERPVCRSRPYNLARKGHGGGRPGKRRVGRRRVALHGRGSAAGRNLGKAEFHPDVTAGTHSRMGLYPFTLVCT